MLFLTQLFGGTGSDRHPGELDLHCRRLHPRLAARRALAQRPLAAFFG